MKPSLQAVDVGLLLPRFGLVEKLIRVKIKPVYHHIRDETRLTATKLLQHVVLILLFNGKKVEA